MTNFEKITETPEALGELLASLTVIDSPWEDAFHKEFCADCELENCDVVECPHEKDRDNPTWWLKQDEKAAPAKEMQERQEIRKTVHASERELLIREYERRLERLKRGASPGNVIFKV